MISREVIQQEYQSEVNEYISEARHFKQGEYRYTDVWDMEPCHEYTRRKKHKNNIKYHGDEEWSYMFSRMGFLYTYAIASVFDNQSYISHANSLIAEVLTNTTNGSTIKNTLNRFFKQDLFQRSLDKSIRIICILDYIDICKSNKLEVYFGDYLKRLSKLWDEIFWDDSFKKEKSNWGIIETASLLYSATYLNKDKYVKELKDRLLRQLDVQIKEDGSHSESAPMYLVQIELSLLKYLKENDCTEIELYARKIADYLLEITDPLGNILNIGDTDVTNMSDVFIIASQILKDNKYYQKVTRKPLLLYVYKFDLMIGETLECTDVIRPCQNNVVDLNGITVIRKNDLYLACCNTISDSGHKHCDNASVILMKNKLPILVDCGRYTYKNCSERKYFVSPQCHNTISIREKFVYENSWKYNAGIVYAENDLLLNSMEITSVQMCCKLNSGEEINRIISIIDDDIIISDMVENNNKDWDIYFNFAPHVEIKEEDNKYSGKSGELDFTYMTVDSYCTTVISEGSYSDIYNKKMKIKKVITSTGNNYIHHVFSFGKQSVESISLHSNEITYFCSNGNIHKVLF